MVYQLDAVRISPDFCWRDLAGLVAGDLLWILINSKSVDYRSRNYE